MNALDIYDALYARWPANEYVCVREAPDGAARQGRKIDLLAISLWRSRGHQLDAVEVKVSAADWRRELQHPEKADWWWEHAHRFWVAVPVDLVPMVRRELPPTWGLLSVTEGHKARRVQSNQVVKAPTHDPTPLPWTSVVGILRAGSGAGANALARALDHGRGLGFDEGRRHVERERGDDAFAELREKVREVEAATGLPIARWSYSDNHLFGYDRAEFLDALSLTIRGKTAVNRTRQQLKSAEATLRQAADYVAQLLEKP